ncbi:MAG: hypothetical protein HZB98_04845, partial [Bacteroidia bacterium]|nr:hypothetical protein [Bacteroidia bacterium]
LILKDGGKVTDKVIKVKIQEPVAPVFENSFPNTVFDKRVSVFDKDGFTFMGKWKAFETTGRDRQTVKQSMVTSQAGDELEFAFTGTGVSLVGNWWKDGGKADVYVDGNLHRSIDTYYNFANQQHTETIWHIMNLQPGQHNVKLVVKGGKRPISAGTNVYITSAVVFRTAAKKSDSWKFSFEK